MTAPASGAPVPPRPARHTPGPWHTDDTAGEDIEILDAGRDRVAQVPPCWSFQEITPAVRRRQMANAALIASAPELLAFVERVAADACPHVPTIDCRACRHALTARALLSCLSPDAGPGSGGA